MRKLLFVFLLILLGILLFVTVVSGFPIKKIKIYTFKDIQKSSEELDKTLQEMETIALITYPEKETELSRSMKELETEKQNYLDKAQYSSTEDVARANMQESYDANYLWVKLGNYATKEGIVAKLDFTTSSSGVPGLYDIRFTLDGTYVSITDFIYSIENDQTLNFRIQDFVLVPGGSTEAHLDNTDVENTETDDTQAEQSANSLIKGSDTLRLQAKFAVRDLVVSF